MPKKTAKLHSVVFFIYPGVKLLDLAGPLQVFNDATDQLSGAQTYRTALVSADGAEVATDTPVSVRSEPAAQWCNPIDTLVVVGGRGAQAASRNAVVVDTLKRLANRSHRIASICTGAFLLGAAGLLEGRRAVTHWRYCTDLARDHPETRVDTNPIFIRDGHIWTSAGVTAGIDLALALVQQDLGRDASLSIARDLVVFAVRSGGQDQFSTTLHSQVSDQSSRFDKLHAWMQENLHDDLSVEALSDRVGMSPRNFARQYQASTGSTPAKAVEAMRVEAARRYLEETDLTVVRVAEICGFRSDERMRKSFIRTLGVPPHDYRRQFQGEVSSTPHDEES
ncbi:GlxA family transcriptional regulator [uncultured Roseibium sp.]|uniref:GlxA family transcriptional regulator n=1 Tax=uncultured Roseibium sp. TaxID=1936171 RepID=UPI00261F8F4D|nr:GlxA family transcriptional regulator [uncultured Roseibium sp.]